VAPMRDKSLPRAALAKQETGENPHRS